jgi:hypothetical protein
MVILYIKLVSFTPVMPMKIGIQLRTFTHFGWIPAFAGMTKMGPG